MADSKNILLRSKKRKAEELLRAQNFAEARVALEQICRQDPRDHESWINLGAVNGRLGALEGAESAFKRALALRGDDPQLLINLARLADLQGRFGDEVEYCQRYLRLRPNDGAAHAQVARLLHQLGRLTEAEVALREALRCVPGNAAFINNLGIVLNGLGRADEAQACYQEALRLDPRLDDACCNLGNLAQERGERGAAEGHYLAALKLNPQNFEVKKNLGVLYLKSGRNGDALRCFEERLQQLPECADSHWNRALLLLAEGRLREGWHEYEWRFRCDALWAPPLQRRLTSKPLWDGVPLKDQRLLVYAEQGIGDTLQFCRYLPLVRQRVERVLFEVPPELHRLLSANMPGIDLIERRSDLMLPEAEYDLQVPLLSLPRLFDTALETIPANTPYISVDPALADVWRPRIDRRTFNVGLVWAGSREFKGDRERSLTLEMLAPLAGVEGVAFYSLQKGAAAAEASTSPAAMALNDLAPQLNDFADTAAAIAQLDLVISVDTAVAHLAGAMGKPVWALIYSPPDWRWLLDRDDSPWYPAMRLFRQPQAGEWDAVIGRVAAELRRTASGE